MGTKKDMELFNHVLNGRTRNILINKIDVQNANIEKVKKSLSEMNILVKVK